MTVKTPISTLEQEERRLHNRLAAYRAKLYRKDGASPIAVDIKLRELERRWRGAADRLRRARRGDR